MGYLDNSSITVDAILTKKGRELLAKNNGSFNITQFALGDDEIDYTLFNENHPNGTQYASEAIENMPLIEAIPDGGNMLQSKLVTLARGTSAIPYIQISNQTGLEINKGVNITVSPQTYNMDGNNNAAYEPGGYRFTIVDNRLREVFQTSQASRNVGMSSTDGTYGNSTSGLTISPVSNIATAETVVGRTLSFRATNNDSLFSTTLTSLTTSLIIEGMNSGARLTVPLTVKSS